MLSVLAFLYILIAGIMYRRRGAHLSGLQRAIPGDRDSLVPACGGERVDPPPSGGSQSSEAGLVLQPHHGTQWALNKNSLFWIKGDVTWGYTFSILSQWAAVDIF